MSDRVFCPVKEDTIGGPAYLKWVQFCERTCPCGNDEELCCHPLTEISFPAHSKKVLTEKVDEVTAAWEAWNKQFAAVKPKC